MASTLFLGTHPGLTAEMLKAEIGAIQAFAGGLRDSLLAVPLLVCFAACLFRLPKPPITSS